MGAARSGVERRARLEQAKLYLVLEGGAAERVLPGALGAGVDVVQLRDREASDAGLLAAGGRMRELCAEHDALFLVNDWPEVALELGADGVHLGQDDEPVAAVRRRVGGELLIGLSTHSPQQFDVGLDSEADYLSAGPIEETPTKPGRPATGLGLIEHAARVSSKPFFAIGGIDARTIGPALDAGARRVVVVRAIRDAPDPATATDELRRALENVAERAAVGGQ